MFNCARCRRLVVICTRCDRGQRYCSAHCGQVQRRQSVREAGRRYQQTPPGARNNAARLEQAIREAIDKDTPHHHAVRQILERQRRAEGRSPTLPVELPDDPRVRDLTIRPHTLESYDELTNDIVDSQEPDDHGEQGTDNVGHQGEQDTDNVDHQENNDHDERPDTDKQSNNDEQPNEDE